ncbi:efflux transporter outer membrane subunit [Duganella sp. BJB488]|uniref:efflux transporter outer membrane subunit n=1 Tax=unclassified Duganella TaxID=2636909 RepID=UPI000E3522C3|nr:MULTISPECIES: efflux transporter outer membrane subunit [unclassified Duganella]RFP17709.1 efflux transporter outer membrane subunit [Duganella sp. BJB489]RFP22218.1 efflux transporter outer membrane subunit [Duganella sp. BJB488]RFP37552.1 efflux transporter outer membrane subunit [Duganella sp. BJB480]
MFQPAPFARPRTAVSAAALSAVLSAAMLLPGCGSMAPQYARPPLPVADRYDAPAATGAAAALPEWRGYFAPPALQAMIVEALAQNRDLRIAALRVEQARAAYGIERANRFPIVAAQASGQRQQVPADLSLTRHEMITSQYQAGLGVSAWEIDLWGRLASLRGAALEDYLASDAARRAITMSLITHVAEGYFDVREIDQRIALARRTLATRQESYRIFSRRVAVGATSRLNLTQVETLLLQAQALASQLEQERDRKRHALQLLVGGPNALAPLDAEAANAAGNLADPLPALAPGLPSALLERRADIVAAEHQLRAANANIGAARATFFPQVSLTAALGTASAELDGLFAGGSRSWTFAPSITLPLFDGDRRRQNLTLAEARRDSAIANYEKTIQGAFRDVADALSAQTWLTAQVGIAERTLQVQRERARLSQLRYDSGAAPFLDVLDAQRDLLSAEQQLIQLRRALLGAGIALYSALGGDPVLAAPPLASIDLPLTRI